MANKLMILGALIFLLCSCGNKGKEQMTDVPKPVGTLLEEAYKNGDWDKIISIGDTLIGEDDPMNISIAYAEALAAKGNIEKAIKVLDKKISKNPGDYYLYNTKGNVFYKAEEYDSAIVCYDKVIELKPTYPRPYVFEGEIYSIRGEKQKAIARYLEAVRLFAANDFIGEAEYFCYRILEIDSTNVEAKKYLEQIQGE